MVTILQNMFTFIAQIVKTLNAKPQIKLFSGEHFGNSVVKIVFDFSPEINCHLKKNTSARWSNELNSWHIARDEFKLSHFFDSMKGICWNQVQT